MVRWLAHGRVGVVVAIDPADPGHATVMWDGAETAHHAVEDLEHISIQDRVIADVHIASQKLQRDGREDRDFRSERHRRYRQAGARPVIRPINEEEFAAACVCAGLAALVYAASVEEHEYGFYGWAVEKHMRSDPRMFKKGIHLGTEIRIKFILGHAVLWAIRDWGDEDREEESLETFRTYIDHCVMNELGWE
jgi:hypothetical protein